MHANMDDNHSPNNPSAKGKSAADNKDVNSETLRKQVLQDNIEKLILDLFSLATRQPLENIHVDDLIKPYLVEKDIEPKFQQSIAKIIGKVPPDILSMHQTLRQLSEYILRHYTREIEYLYGTNPSLHSDSCSPQTSPKVPANSNASSTHGAGRTYHYQRSQSPSLSYKKKQVAQPDHANRRLQAPQVRASDIAIIGVSGRFPQADNLDQFWHNLNSGQVSITPIPDSRLECQHSTDAMATNPSKTSSSSSGGFLPDIDKFDPSFFNISPAEAASIDPQERIMLELVEVALENAGYGMVEQLGAEVGVYIAASGSGYPLTKNNAPLDPPQANHVPSPSIANRVSHVFNFQGPSITLDTHVSSTLIALHLACQAIRTQEIDAAIVGGIHLCIQPRDVSANDLGEQATDGIHMGEGAGAILIKPLAKAIADKDSIQAIIKGSTLSHTGASVNYGSPNPDAFTRVIKKAYDTCGIARSSINFIETHGFGHHPWDKLEIDSLNRVFSPHVATCSIGNVKHNIGNLTTAAGIASLLKVILQLQHKTIAPTPYHCPGDMDTLLNGTPFSSPTQSIDWNPLLDNKHDKQTIPRRAGINAFGDTGNHAHVIIEQSPPDAAPQADHEQDVIIILSGDNRNHLRVMAHELLTFVVESSQSPDAPVNNLPSLAYTLQVGRRAMNERLAFIVSSIHDFAVKLERLQHTGNLEDIGIVGNPARQDNLTRTLLKGSTGQAFIKTLIKKQVLYKLSMLWVNGFDIAWPDLYEVTPHRISLPTYPWQRKTYWLDQTQPQAKPISNNAANTPTSAPQENEFVCRELTATLSDMLWMDANDFNSDVALENYGVDTELSHKFADHIHNRFGIRIHESDISADITLQQLTHNVIDTFAKENLPVKLKKTNNH